MKAVLFSLFLSITSANAAILKSKVRLVRVYKNEHKLELVGKDNRVLKTYTVMLGKAPEGPKTEEGDNKTPEGTYTLDIKNPQSKFHKSLHISYPNKQDIAQARARGVNPGNEIMLHGLPNDYKAMKSWLDKVGLGGFGDDIIRGSIIGKDWTSGCIAVENDEIDEIYKMIDVPTKITIYP